MLNDEIPSQRFQQRYPTLRPLVLTLKHLLFLRGLNKPYHGGLSSYALVLMVVAFLQTPELYGNKQDIGKD
jgi:DNA polymerase sigma